MTPPIEADFWRDRAVLVTGHTGFKGAWLTLWLQALGARVTGFADRVPTNPSLYELARAGDGISDVRGDVRDHAAVLDAFAAAQPEIVIHMAAQAFVRRSFAEPRETYETNVMGTVNVLEAVRATPSVRAVVNVTSDKCYDNFDGRPPRPFVEDDPKGGHDPYSNSKGCAELVSDAYLRSFFAPDGEGPRLASARAGNVIGGGDWGEDRLIPDIMRGALAGEPIPVRNPEAVRPWQHVLNPLRATCDSPQAAARRSRRSRAAGTSAPTPGDAQPVRSLADRLTELWPGELRWELDPGPHPHEAHHLALDSSKAREQLGWAPAWGLEEALAGIVQWYRALAAGEDMRAVTLAQIESFGATRAAPGPSAS